MVRRCWVAYQRKKICWVKPNQAIERLKIQSTRVSYMSTFFPLILSRTSCSMIFKKLRSFQTTTSNVNLQWSIITISPLPLNLRWNVQTTLIYFLRCYPYHSKNILISNFISQSLTTHPSQHISTTLILLACCSLVTQHSVMYNMVGLQAV